MSNLIDIQSQIEKLQRQASEIKAREFDKTVQEIIAKMQAFGITLKDLQPVRRGRAAAKSKAQAPAGARKKGGKPKGTKAGAVVVPKYRGPNGETWTGRGLTPRWLAALVAQGQSKESYLIAS